MAKNMGRNARLGAVKARTQVEVPESMWIKPDTGTGRFLNAKANGGGLGTKRPWWRFWR